MRLICLIFALVLSGCHPKATAPEPISPPPVAETQTAPMPVEKYPHQHPARSQDLLIKNCTVTRESGNHADCICRNATTHLDANDPRKQMMVCK